MDGAGMVDLSTLDGGQFDDSWGHTRNSSTDTLGITMRREESPESQTYSGFGSASRSPPPTGPRYPAANSLYDRMTSTHRNNERAEESRTVSDQSETYDQSSMPPIRFPLIAGASNSLASTPETLYDPPRPAMVRNDSGDDAESRGLKSEGMGRPMSEMLSPPGTEYCNYHDDEADFLKKYSNPPTGCHSRADVAISWGNWISYTTLILSIYSTAGSILWLVVASIQPRWGTMISSGGRLLPSTASLVTAGLAKSIEITFVTVFVTLIGQALTRRSFTNRSSGMTIAEITMRNWVIQPGNMITYIELVPSALKTISGVLIILATFPAMFYTTASDAMVTPKLKYGGWEDRVLQGHVRSVYGNIEFAKRTCAIPSIVKGDEYSGESCINVVVSGQSYHNIEAYLSDWHDIQTKGLDKSTDLSARPRGTATLYDNTTLTSSWVDRSFSDVETSHKKHGRIINNVTLAMPHPGVFSAATSPLNTILQPKDLSGVGEYKVKASVVSPSVNVMCVNMNREELAPLVYTEWPNARTKASQFAPYQKVGEDDWSDDVPSVSEGEWWNRTVVDDVFRWGKSFDRRPPLFPSYPIANNMLTYASAFEERSDALYLLGKKENFDNYTLCELRSWLSPYCSTSFFLSGTDGGHLQSHCEDPEDPNSYLNAFGPVDFGPTWANKDWHDLAVQWALSINLNGGSTNNNASNARILTQLALKEPQLSATVPSMAEALAVLASSTLVIGSVEAPFRHYWNYDNVTLEAPGALEGFRASLSTQEYTSGHIAPWHAVFYAVLALVVVFNVLCLVYFLCHDGFVTDYTEPCNLFGLAINSPPSRQLYGTCGGGPAGPEMWAPWKVRHAPSANHFYFEEAMPLVGKYKSTAEAGRQLSTKTTTTSASYKRLSSSKTWL